MYSVGILSDQGKWSHLLGEMLSSSGTRITGWINPKDAPPPVMRELIDYSDLIWIPEKTGAGMDAAIEVIRRSRHLSLGFPVAEFADEVPCLVKLAHEARVQVQVGNSDWHLPVVRSSLQHIRNPQNITVTEVLPVDSGDPESQRVFRSVLSNLDLALGLAGSTVRKIRPHASRHSGGGIIQLDIRLDLHNGSIINLLIRRLGSAPSRCLSIIQAGSYLSLDLLADSGEMTRFGEESFDNSVSVSKLWPLPGHEDIPDKLPFQGEIALARQCLTFIRALEKGRHPLANLESGFRALEMTRQIESHLGSL